MNVLQINLLFVFLVGILGMLRNKASEKVFLSFIAVVFIILNGLRHENVGTDTFRYYKRFVEIMNVSDFNNFIKIDMEIGYKLAQKVFQVFSRDFNMWLLVVSIFIYVITTANIYKYSQNCFLSIFLFITLGYFDFSFTGIRQTLAIIIIFNSYKYLINKEPIKFVINCLIAASFHSSALVFLPVYVISNLRWKRIHSIYLASILLLVYIFRFQIGKSLTFVYYDEAASSMLSRYTSSGQIGGLAMMTILVLVWGVFIYNPFKYNDRVNWVLTSIVFISVIIQMLSSFSYLFTRLNMYFMIFLILYIPNVLSNMDKIPIKFVNLGYKPLKLIFTLTFIIVLTVYYLKTIEINGANILPYNFYWN